MRKSGLFEFIRKTSSLLLIATTLTVWLPYRAAAADSPERPIIITFGQPNVWSLEQAHYLLARMHREDLDLRTKALGDLDPNEVNAQRVEIIKTLLEIGVKYDDAVRINNQLKQQNRADDSARRQELLSRQTALRRDSTELARAIANAKLARAKAPTDEARTLIDAEIAAKTEEKAAIDSELSLIQQDLAAMPATPTGDLSSTSDPGGSFDKSKLPEGALEAALRAGAGSTTNGSSLTASQKLTNHVNMQYEIIAKQLTLLRDEVGPGERLVFLELPQSIKTSQNRAGKKIVQTWWRIASYTTVDRHAERQAEYAKLGDEIKTLSGEISAEDATLIDLEGKLSQLKAKLNSQNCPEVSSPDSEAREDCSGSGSFPCCELRRAIAAIENRRNDISREQYRMIRKLAELTGRYAKLGFRLKEEKISREREELDRIWAGGSKDTSTVEDNIGNSFRIQKNYTEKCTAIAQTNRKVCVVGSEETSTGTLQTGSVRTVDIIPRENAVNVNDKKEKVNATGIVGAFSFLFGFGGKVQFQRQKDTTEQFMNQELYTSGFGKGETEFGWNFYPFSGTEQVAPGIRTTYAVAIVPQTAETLVLNAKGCYMDRKQFQPLNYAATAEWSQNRDERREYCQEKDESFVVKIPGGGDAADFYATGIRYSKDREPGDRIVVSIYGKNFSPNIGVLVDGFALTQSVGLARDDIESTMSDKVDEGCVATERVCGRYERIDSGQILLSFRMVSSFRGTPEITLVAPGKALSLNSLEMQINGTDMRLEDAPPMFGRRNRAP